jgi:hypothetical protein
MVREIGLFWGLERHFYHGKRASKKKVPTVGCGESPALTPPFLNLKIAV